MFWEMQKSILDSLPKFHICHSSAFEYITWIAIENILKIFPGTQISMDRRHLDLYFVYDECNSH